MVWITQIAISYVWQQFFLIFFFKGKIKKIEFGNDNTHKLPTGISACLSVTLDLQYSACEHWSHVKVHILSSMLLVSTHSSFDSYAILLIISLGVDYTSQ